MPRLLLALLLLAPLAAMQSPAQPEHTLEDLAFVAGHWRGELKGSPIEELWLPAEGSSMVGMFHMTAGGKPGFYEFMAIEQTPTGPVLLLRHYHPGLIGWEEKDAPLRLPLRALEGQRATFDSEEPEGREPQTRLIYQRTGEALQITLSKLQPDGTRREQVFRFQRSR